jgi:hypothetical protein
MRETKGGNLAFANIHNDYLHIPDPNERRRLVLAHIDTDSFGWNHVRAIVVAGIGFFTDAYGVSELLCARHKLISRFLPSILSSGCWDWCTGPMRRTME